MNKAIKQISDAVVSHVQILEAILKAVPHIGLIVFDKNYNYVFGGGAALPETGWNHVIGSNLYNIGLDSGYAAYLETLYSQCLNGKELKVTLPATAMSDTHPHGYPWNTRLIPIYNGASKPKMGLIVLTDPACDIC